MKAAFVSIATIATGLVLLCLAPAVAANADELLASYSIDPQFAVGGNLDSDAPDQSFRCLFGFNQLDSPANGDGVGWWFNVTQSDVGKDILADQATVAAFDQASAFATDLIPQGGIMTADASSSYRTMAGEPFLIGSHMLTAIDIQVTELTLIPPFIDPHPRVQFAFTASLFGVPLPTVPEPSTAALLVIGCVVALVARRR